MSNTLCTEHAKATLHCMLKWEHPPVARQRGGWKILSEMQFRALPVRKDGTCLAQRSRPDSCKPLFWKSTPLFRWLATWGGKKLIAWHLSEISLLAPGLVSAEYLGSQESHQELRRREKHYQRVMQIPGLHTYFRVGWITLSCGEAGSSEGNEACLSPESLLSTAYPSDCCV